MPDSKEGFIGAALESKALKFGSFTLKSHRESPYFFNMGQFSSGRVLSQLAESYAHRILESGLEFDVLFGPAYKGIAIAALTVAKIAEIDASKGNIDYAYNRKEAKDHGEGGSLVGGALKGRRVLIVDDVITAGTAITEAYNLIKEAGGNIVGLVVAVDRQETLPNSDKSALQECSAKFGVPVLSIVTFSDIILALRDTLSPAELSAMQKYKETYGAKGS